MSTTFMFENRGLTCFLSALTSKNLKKRLVRSVVVRSVGMVADVDKALRTE